MQDFKAVVTLLLRFIRNRVLKRILRQTQSDGLLADAVGVALAASLRAFADAARGPKFRSLDQFFRTSPVNPAPAVVTMAIISPG